ncbi:MAG: hypothetical protein Tsb0021_11800 [Chlamydiales bacterium]
MTTMIKKDQIALPECRVRHVFWKRTFDIFFSLLVLTLGFPIFLLIALSILFTSRGSPIFSHYRIGRGGKLFRCYKFRTMFRNADVRLKKILEENSTLRQEWEANQKLKHDPRVTQVGKFLRKTSLDELPQFWNVLIGDLSIVGPRPVVPEELSKHIGEKASTILSVRPGITGLWQVSGRSNTSYRRRVRLDEKYVHNLSFMLDLTLIAKTVPVMITSRGAY